LFAAIASTGFLIWIALAVDTYFQPSEEQLVAIEEVEALPEIQDLNVDYRASARPDPTSPRSVLVTIDGVSAVARTPVHLVFSVNIATGGIEPHQKGGTKR
jgi:hypothetical protein